MKSIRKITALFLTLFVLVVSLAALSACDADIYTVTFDSNGGSAVTSMTVVSGEKLTVPEVPVKEDYVFTGWYDVNGIWDFENPVEKDMTLVAMWKKSADADIVSVEFDSAGGSAVSAVKVGRGATVGEPKAPTRAGYIFTGWMKDGKAYDFSKALSQDVKLTASWDVVEYTISYDVAGGTNARENPAKFTTESDTFTLTAPARLGYEFLGWTVEGQEEPVMNLTITKGSTGDKAVKANWKLNTYTLTFDCKGGEFANAPAGSYSITTKDIAIENPAKADYVFIGWTKDADSEPVLDLVIKEGSVGNLSYTANWKAVEYKINYVLDGGVNSEENPDVFTHEAAVTLKAPSRSGFAFTGWTYDGQDEPVKDVTIALGTKGEKTFTANWEMATYTITYNTFDGESYSELVLNFTALDLPLTPSSLYLKEGNKAFASWCTDEALANPVDLINECKDITLYASFKDANEGLLIENGKVIGYTGEDAVVYIPAYFDGAEVTEIADNAFAGKTVTAVYIPSTVTKIGFAAFSECTALVSVDIKADSKLESVGKNAFAACIALEEIYIPKALTTIGDNAFMSCVSLKNVDIAKDSMLEAIGASAFDSCFSLEAISLPKSLTIVGERAFYHNQSLASVSFEDGAAVSEIGKEAFSGCVKLTGIRIPASVSVIKKNAFDGAALLENLSFEKNSVLKTIESNAFYGCDALVSVEMPASLETIGTNAFAYSDKLETVIFAYNSSLKLIDAYAFYDCESLKTIALPNMLDEIGASAFYNCQKLESLTIGSSVTKIGRSAFYNCNSITELALPMTLASVEKDAFGKIDKLVSFSLGNTAGILEAFGGQLPATIKTVTISASSAIDADFLKNCTGIEELTVPFVGLTAGGKLKDLFGGIVPETLTSVNVTGSSPIASGAFDGASSIKELVLDVGISSIADGALSGLTSLESLEIALVKQAGSDTVMTLSAMFGGKAPASLRTVNVTANSSMQNPIVPENAFVGTSVVTVKLDKKITAIGDSAFKGLTKLVNLEIENGSALTSIGKDAFRACEKLTTVTLKNPEITIGDGAFADSAIVTVEFAPNSAAVFGIGVFENCKYLASFDTAKAGLTVISEATFKNCILLSSLTVSDTVAAIGDSAFEGCVKLEALTFGAESALETIGAYAFAGSALKTFTVPEKVVNIAEGTFKGCSALESVVFTETSLLKEIGKNAFDSSAIKAISVPASVEKIQESAFANCDVLVNVTFAENSALTKISTGAFENCVALEAIAIPDGISSIANNTFNNCKKLKSVSFGENSALSSVMAYAFNYCIRLESIALPKTVSYIGEKAFALCYSLEELSFGEGSVLSVIETQAFFNCDSLTKVTIPAGVVTIGEKAFASCDSLEEVKFEDGSIIEIISAYVFNGSAKLAKVNIPDSVKTIETGAFSGCLTLNELVIGENSLLASIGDNAFRNCKALVSFKTPAGVESIGIGAFAGCSALESVTLSVDIDVVSDDAFSACTKLVITINYSDDTDNGNIPAGWKTEWNSFNCKLEWVDLTPAALPAE